MIVSNCESYTLNRQLTSTNIQYFNERHAFQTQSFATTNILQRIILSFCSSIKHTLNKPHSYQNSTKRKHSQFLFKSNNIE